MSWIRRAFRKSQAEKSLDKELQFHLDRQLADYVAAGMQPDEARHRARLEFGILDTVKEEVRDTRWETRLEDVFRDFRYAARSLRKDRRFAIVAVVALLLVVIGIFSVMAYTVSLQTHEIGVRMALGAQQDNILKMVLARGARIVAAGIIIGIFASYGITRFLASQVWGVSTADPWTFGLVAIVATFVGLAACYIPARRATCLDPMAALRYE
jgi:ABC-type lipoprotein release transport system permease subunit